VKWNSLWILLLWVAACRNGSAPSDQVLSTPLQEAQFDDLVKLYENEERDSWQIPDEVLAKFGDLRGKTVVDLGAGSGYFSFRMLPMGARVIALEIDERFTGYLEQKAQLLPDTLRKRLDIRLATPSDPFLRQGEADYVLVVNTYIYVQERIPYFSKIRAALKEGGELLVVEYHKKPQRKGPPLEIRLAAHQVAEELIQAGFEVEEEDLYTLPYQYMIRAR
jgi:SAM-dependent methyltransferase